MNHNLIALALLALGAYWVFFKSDILRKIGQAKG